MSLTVKDAFKIEEGVSLPYCKIRRVGHIQRTVLNNILVHHDIGSEFNTIRFRIHKRKGYFIEFRSIRNQVAAVNKFWHLHNNFPRRICIHGKHGNNNKQ